MSNKLKFQSLKIADTIKFVVGVAKLVHNMISITLWNYSFSFQENGKSMFWWIARYIIWTNTVHLLRILWYPQFLKTKILINLIIYLCFIYIYIFYLRLPEDEMKKVEMCRSISSVHVEVYILMLVHLSVLSVKST